MEDARAKKSYWLVKIGLLLLLGQYLFEVAWVNLAVPRFSSIQNVPPVDYYVMFVVLAIGIWALRKAKRAEKRESKIGYVLVLFSVCLNISVIAIISSFMANR
jgi:FtsH-binding integral membrane protein